MRSIPLIDLVPTHKALEARVLAAVKSVYRRNAFVLGNEVRDFEAAFAKLCGVRHAVGLSSGTAALTLSLRAMGVGPGDEVVTTPYTFFATASAIIAAGATPRFADVDPGTLNIDPAKADAACGRRTRAVLPVHIFGQPAAMDRIVRAARRRGLPVLEDACQAHGARYAGKPVGAWGRAACFSFYPSKNVGALGDAGLVATGDAALAERLRMLRNCGRPSTGSGQAAAYQHLEMGYVERLDNLQAAVLSVKLEKLSAWNRERRRLAALYAEELAGTPARPLVVDPQGEPVFHLYTVRAPRRDALKQRLGERGIGAGVFYQTPLHLQPAFKSLGYRAGDFPEAERASREALSLPLYPGLPPGDVVRVAREVRRFYRGG